MSFSRPPNSDKTEMSGSTIGFRFHANEEQLEEVQSKEDSPDVKEENAYLKLMTDFLKPEVLDGGKVLSELDGMKEQRNFLGKRSVSVDSPSESPFPNTVERWKKFSDFREKITKTVEGKISEMKIERNVLGKTKPIHSKENSSLSDSEDTSESSKISEQCKDVENQILMPEMTIVQNSETLSNALDTSVSEVKKETDHNEGDNELRKRKSFPNFSELLNLQDIKIAVAKKDEDPNAIEELDDEVESGIEAEEAYAKDESESVTLFDADPDVTEGRDSNNPPFDDTFGGALASVILSQTNTAVFLLLFFLYVFVPLPEFFKGCLLSFLLVLFWGTVKEFMQCEEMVDRQMSYATLDVRSVSQIKVPKSDLTKGVWFNEYERETYDPDYYSVTHTVPVYLELEGPTLKVSRAKGKIRRRATYDEPEYKLPIINKRIFNLRGCSVYLLPEGLTRKRLFSKKYPIVILLKKDSLISERRNGKEIEDRELPECFEGDIEVSTTAISPKNKCTLFLFARCDRQKEEWYRRLLAATKVSTRPSQDISPKVPELPKSYIAESETERGKQYEEKIWSDENPVKESLPNLAGSFFADEGGLLEEYFHYMAAFASVKNHEESKEMGDDFIAMQTQIQWFNAFVNRILFDVFRSPYWLSKIQDKVQRKINSIRMPYYIEDIEVIEMDLGKTGPMFHRVSSPYLDDRGLWFDMDLTFNGLIRITIQTHLNLVKLQKGAEEIEAATHASVSGSHYGSTAPLHGSTAPLHGSAAPLQRGSAAPPQHGSASATQHRPSAAAIQHGQSAAAIQHGSASATQHRSSAATIQHGPASGTQHRPSAATIQHGPASGTQHRPSAATIQHGPSAAAIQQGASLASASSPEKMKKGKKSDKSEKESKTNIYHKESTEMSTKPSTQLTSIEAVPRKPKPISKTELPEVESRTNDEYTEKLMDEVSQFAEIAVEEVISKSKEQETKGCPPCPCPDTTNTRSAIYDSELEDSAESSSEEEETDEHQPVNQNPSATEETRPLGKRYPRNRRSSKRIFKVFENVAQSKYFRTMAQSKYVQKAIAGVSAAKLRLTIEVKSCSGILAVNIPPPPTDRFWYGFRKMPTLAFSANPKIGDKAVRFIHIRNYLHKKILYELKKVMVTPNMIDFVLPTSAPARSSSFVHVAEPDMQEETLSE